MVLSTHGVTSVEDCRALIAQIESDPDYHQPTVYAVGIAHRDTVGYLDTWFPLVNLNENLGVAALLANEVGYYNGVVCAELDTDQIGNVRHALRVFKGDGGDHPNLVLLDRLWNISRNLRTDQRIVVSFIGDHETQPPVTVQDAYLRLHLLSHRKVQPHGVNLDGIFSILPNIAWTNQGPMRPDDVDMRQLDAYTKGEQLTVDSVDKFPQMINYVRPSGVRIADGARVRLGAYLANGTTVMHEGFVNFNAGTLGPCMVEGRISAGVVVGTGSDIGGGASIMGTLSGGNLVRVSIGEHCLLEAESGLGIPIGDRVRVSVGDYIKGGTLVRINRNQWFGNTGVMDALSHHEGGSGAYLTIKAGELAGISDAIFRRNDRDGVIEVVPRGNSTWGKLTEFLHNN